MYLQKRKTFCFHPRYVFSELHLSCSIIWVSFFEKTCEKGDVTSANTSANTLSFSCSHFSFCNIIIIQVLHCSCLLCKVASVLQIILKYIFSTVSFFKPYYASVSIFWNTVSSLTCRFTRGASLNGLISGS